MLILILIDVQYLQKAVFNLAKGLSRQNHSSSGFFHLMKKSPSKISDSPQLGRTYTPPFIATWKTLHIFSKYVIWFVELCSTRNQCTCFQVILFLFISNSQYIGR